MSIVIGIEKVDTPVEVLVLNMAQIAEVLTYQDVLEALDAEWKAYGSGEFDQPPAGHFSVGPPEDFNMASTMPGYVKGIDPKEKSGTFGVKWGAMFSHQVPKVWGGIVVLNRADNGLPFAIMDGMSITTTRTAGHAAIAAKYLAKKDSRVIAIIGCGTEGRTHLAALNELFPLEVVKIYDIDPGAMDNYKQEMSELCKLQIVPAASSGEAVKGADIICTVTTALQPVPVVLESSIPAGCFVAGMALFRDLDPLISKKADKWVIGYQSSDESNLKRVHSFTADDLKAIYANMGEIATGKKPGRENDKERIVYTHTGAGNHDVVVATVAYNKAVKQGLGTKIRLA
jgi:ornithine cyclodeaminase/alanine dehydrogenase-like protein (mu-crystallin family)